MRSRKHRGLRGALIASAGYAVALTCLFAGLAAAGPIGTPIAKPLIELSGRPLVPVASCTAVWRKCAREYDQCTRARGRAWSCVEEREVCRGSVGCS